MDTRQLHSMLREMESQLATAESEAKTAVRRVDALHKAIDGIKEVIATLPAEAQRLFDEPAPVAPRKAVRVRVPANGNAPRGREAVSRVLLEARKPMNVFEIVDDLRERGWMTNLTRPAETVSVTAKRLVGDGVLEETGKRTYRYRLDKLPPIPEVEASPEPGGTPD